MPSLTDLFNTCPSEDKYEGIKFNSLLFDRLFGEFGAEYGTKIFLSAPPASGKTSLALQWATHAMLQKHPVLWLAGEMRLKDLRTRLFQQLLGWSKEKVRRKDEDLSQRDSLDRSELVRKIGSLGSLWQFVEAPFTTDEIANWVKVHSAKFIVIDYLQTIRSKDSASTNSIDRLDTIVSELNELAQKNGIVMLIISNMAKGDMRNRNLFNSFKGSSLIEFSADLAFVGQLEESPRNPRVPRVTFKCLKNRHNEAVDIDTYFDKTTQRFRPFRETQ
jgi:replicative DNA helicase